MTCNLCKRAGPTIIAAGLCVVCGVTEIKEVQHHDHTHESHFVYRHPVTMVSIQSSSTSTTPIQVMPFAIATGIGKVVITPHGWFTPKP